MQASNRRSSAYKCRNISNTPLLAPSIVMVCMVWARIPLFSYLSKYKPSLKNIVHINLYFWFRSFPHPPKTSHPTWCHLLSLTRNLSTNNSALTWKTWENYILFEFLRIISDSPLKKIYANNIANRKEKTPAQGLEIAGSPLDLRVGAAANMSNYSKNLCTTLFI